MTVMRIRPSRWLHKAVAALLVAGFFLSSGGQKLCIGADGRVAVESASPLAHCSAARCTGEQERQHGTTTGPIKSGCTDVPLVTAVSVRPQRDCDLAGLLLAKSVVWLHAVNTSSDLTAASVRPLRYTRLLLSSAPTVLRSTILLI